MLTKEQKLAILSKAIDEGAQIDVLFYRLPKVKAQEIASDFADDMKAIAYEKTRGTSYWYTTKEEGNSISITAFYEPETDEGYMEEDVIFEEEVEV